MEETFRRIQLIFNAGFGAITSLRTFTGMVKHPSVDPIPWNRSKKIYDLRLQKILRVDHFKLPPDSETGWLGITPFPRMYNCPVCKTLRPIEKWFDNITQRSNLNCPECQKGGNRVKLIPSRFIVICPKGHLDDFPYFKWVHSYGVCSKQGTTGLKFYSGGFDSSLANIKIKCLDCGRERSMAGALDPSNHVPSNGNIGYKCTGNFPEKLNSETCDQYCSGNKAANSNQLSFVLRSASNIYFPIINSSLLLPTEDSAEIEFIKESDYFKDLVSNETDEDEKELLFRRLTKNLIKSFDICETDAQRYIQTAIDLWNVDSERDWESFRYNEYISLIENHDTRNFISTVIREKDLKGSKDFFISSITEVERMRQVSALTGYTRVAPINAEDPTINELDDDANHTSRVKVIDLRTVDSHGDRTLPAVESFGEGIFINFSSDMMKSYEDNCAERLRKLRNNITSYNAEFSANLAEPNARFVALHSLSHQIIKEISFEIGYNLASIKERIYCNSKETRVMNGILLYIVEQDVMGTLGGLSRLATDDKISKLIKRAIEHSEWCSNDPVCYDSDGQGMGGLNLAACHSCLLLPETCCEYRNRFLDRKIMQTFFSI